MILLGLAALSVLLLLGAAGVVDRLRYGDRRQLERIDQLHLRLNDAFSLLRDMETSQRGYLLTRDESFLEPYTQAASEYPEAIAQVRQLSTNEYIQSEQLTQSLQNFDDAAQRWQEQAATAIELRRGEELDRTQLQSMIAEGSRLFDEIRSYKAETSETITERRDELQTVIDRYVDASFVLLALVTCSTLATLGYSILLVRRVGLLASALQARQQRQEAYTQVIAALNGPTRLQPLLQDVLPLVLDTVGAQAGVVYNHEDEVLQPVSVVGLDREALKPLKSDEGLPGTALREQRTIITADLSTDMAYGLHTGVGVVAPRSLVNVPLQFGSQCLGVLTIATINDIDEDDIRQLDLIASQLSTAISNVRAFEETQRIAEKLAQNNQSLERLLETSETLQDIGRELVMQSDLQTLLNLVCREARRVLRADYAAVATIIDAEGSTRWVAIDGASSELWRHAVFPPHTGMAGWAVDKAGPIVIQGDGQDSGFSMEELPIYAAESMQAALGVPLFRKETPIGALILAYRSEHQISDGEIELATALASYASIAIENARLLSELQRERDIAEERARELTAKNKEVERANQLKSQFVANMSHELRTPLNSILALSQILLDRFDGDLNPEQEKQVRIIERNGANLLRLINDILDLSKVEAGRIELSLSSFTLPELVGSVRSTIAPLAADKGLQLYTELESDLPTCFTDENKLKQILLNLLGNAVKFTPQGSVTLRVRNGCEVGQVVDTSPWVTFEVEDTGIGIAPQDQTAVWEEFRQLDGSLSRRFEGTGLGLAITRRLVQLMGGEITLESVVDKGSIFRFSLPVRVLDARLASDGDDGDSAASVERQSNEGAKARQAILTS
jgi:signal transduction histidine kinase/CHASE3 domain sensor protein